MNRIAKFEKVSLNQFIKDWIDTYGNKPDDVITEIYNSIQLPKRKTRYSAGHDISVPMNITLSPNDTIMIPTGLRCIMNSEYVMLIFPRSSLGIKKNMSITNTIPVIDADYFYADNSGHIFICIKNCGQDVIELKAGDAFCQALFFKYGVADDDVVTNVRTGGIGSTNII